MARIFQKKQATIKGFSLMELMVTVAIVGVLTAVAMPSYSGYIDRSRRGDGMDLFAENCSCSRGVLFGKQALYI